MASLISPKKIDLTKINGGYKLTDNSILTAETMNEIASGVAYNTLYNHWAFAFTDLQELINNIKNIYGNVLVKDITISSNLVFPTVEQGKTINVVFDNCKLAQGFSINLGNWSMSGLYLESNSIVNGGVNVSNCTGYGTFYNVKNLSYCDLNIAGSCECVHDIIIGLETSKSEVFFDACILVSNISSYAEKTYYRDCHGINSVNGNNEFIDCTYVDPFTCGGFVKDEDVGKIPTLSLYGGFVPYDLKADEEFIQMINEGGIE